MIVVWRVTERCNLRCPFCAYDRRIARARAEANAAAIHRFGEVLSEYQRGTGDAVLVSWMGGEPLLWRPLRSLSEQFHRTLGLRISSTTNGTSLRSPVMRDHILECYAELTVSVDRLGSAHDALRGWPGGFAALRTGVSALAEAKARNAAGPTLRANIVLMRDNIDELEMLSLELAEWGVTEITFNQLGGNDRPDFHRAHRLLPEQVDRVTRLIPYLRQLLDQRGVRLNGGSAYLRRMQASARDERIAIANCHPGERFLFIDEHGIAAPCSFTPSTYGLPIAEIGSAADVLALPGHFSAKRDAARASACDDCHSTQVFHKFVPVLA